MLVLGVAVKMARRRLEDMRGRNPSGRNAPSAILQKKSGFWLRAGQAELAGIARQAPGGGIFTQGLEPLGNGRFVEPFDLVVLAARQGFQTIGRDELYGPRAILADMRDEREGTACRDLKFLGPSIKHALIVRQQS